MAATYQADTSPIVDTFADEQLQAERTVSRDYTATDEWDASKTPPSRFQKRKGSIYATPSSRDGHVERNRDAVEEFHRAYSKLWSAGGATGHRRNSSGGSSSGGGGGIIFGMGGMGSMSMTGKDGAKGGQ
ncbi:hypothetical protein GGS23DRAFT_143673 [Durotheca rogersii]|uniref:uncharacterized protein n=1 Tax=Durotheca rogersii TaxID=419775 RepID=UPI0022208ECC|nr:uncharacterized protein GGS23DRAFT_143673 [Durotheca rogersii]KAI5861646.1 hypothetical protein GGS23DRAFT_143673 [Durotheca rogersii]